MGKGYQPYSAKLFLRQREEHYVARCWQSVFLGRVLGVLRGSAGFCWCSFLSSGGFCVSVSNSGSGSSSNDGGWWS